MDENLCRRIILRRQEEDLVGEALLNDEISNFTSSSQDMLSIYLDEEKGENDKEGDLHAEGDVPKTRQNKCEHDVDHNLHKC